MKILDKESKKEIVDAIRKAETLTSGEIRVHLKSKCGTDVMAEAKKAFHRLRMHHKKEKNAVLIFVAPESRRFAILGDEGIHRHAGDAFWHETRDTMASFFAKEKIKEGILAGVRIAGEKLQKHFPAGQNNLNEISKNVTEG